MRALLFFLLLRAVFPAVSLSCFPGGVSAYQGEKVYLTFEVRGLLPDTLGQLSLSYHLYDSRGRLVRFENPRFRPPARRKFSLPVFFAAPPGEYTVEFEFLKEGEFWGRDRGWRPCRLRLSLKGLFSPEFRRKYLPRPLTFKDESLVRLQYLLRLTYLNNEIRKNGALWGFSAGSHYPQLWIRDLASAIPYALEFYRWDQLRGSLEAFLMLQGRDGEIPGWIGTDLKTGKNTVSSDQEPSLVLAAYFLARKNPSWLCREVKGLKVVDRLAGALMWLWRNRRDPETGLIWSGFKADWGDVSLQHPRDPTHFHPGDLKVVGIYTQARFYRALEAIVRMERWCPLRRRPPLEAMARRIKQASLRYLYLPREGYFLIHRVLGTTRYLEMERKILPVGGNAEAMLAGFMSRRMVKRFFQVHRKRMETLGVSSPSFVLLPPYPEGFFPFHLMKPWHYQNGGGWDWIGARLVQALLSSGFDKEGEEYLKEIVRRNLLWFSIYEWFDRQGRGWGAFSYTAAAGEMGQALKVLSRIKVRGSLDRKAKLW